MKNPYLLALVVLSCAALRGPAGPLGPPALTFRPCRLEEYHGDKTSRLDTSGAHANAIYARIGSRLLCVLKCGSLYVFPAGRPTSSFRPTYFEQTCSGQQWPYAEQAVANGERYIFLFSAHDTYVTRPCVKLLRVDLYTAKVQVLDSGALGPELAWEASTQTLVYRKAGKPVAYHLP